MNARRQDVWEIDRRLNAGESSTSIAADLGVTPGTLRNWLNSEDLPSVRVRRHRERQARLHDPKWLFRRYVLDAESASTIAAMLQVPTSEVGASLERHGINRQSDEHALTRAKLLEAFNAGESVKSIARNAGVDSGTVRRTMRKHGIVNPRQAPERSPLLDDPTWLRSRYLDDQFSAKQIADECGSHERSVRAALRRHTIPIRATTRKLDPETARHQFLAEGASLEQIAADAGVTVRTVRRVLKEHGVQIRRPNHQTWARSNGGQNCQWLRYQVIVRHRTYESIAADAEVSLSTIGSAVRDNNVRRGPRRRGATGLKDRQWMHTRYIVDGATAPDIAAELNVTTRQVRNALAHLSITKQRPV